MNLDIKSYCKSQTGVTLVLDTWETVVENPFTMGYNCWTFTTKDNIYIYTQKGEVNKWARHGLGLEQLYSWCSSVEKVFCCEIPIKFGTVYVKISRSMFLGSDFNFWSFSLKKKLTYFDDFL